MLFKKSTTDTVITEARTRDAIAKLHKGLQLSGFYPPEKHRWLYYIWRAIALSYGVVYLPLSFLLNYVIYFAEFTPSEFLISLQLCFNCWCFAVKYFTLFMFRERLNNARIYLDKLDEHCTTEEQKNSIREIVIFGNKMYSAYIIVYFCYATSSLFDGLRSGRPTYNTYYPFVNWRLNKQQLYLQAVIEYITVGYAISVATITDSYALLYVEPLRGHVNILKTRLKAIGLIDHSERNAKINHEELVMCIKYHKTMLGYIEIIRPVISVTIFAQFVICGSILGVSAINLMLFTDLASRIQIISYLGAVFLQTFPLCYYCTCLVDDCDDLATAIFHSNWMYEDQRYKKTLLQFLQKLQQPMTFTALGIFSINLNTNINVAKFAFTVYALAKGMNMEEIFFQTE